MIDNYSSYELYELLYKKSNTHHVSHDYLKYGRYGAERLIEFLSDKKIDKSHKPRLLEVSLSTLYDSKFPLQSVLPEQKDRDAEKILMKELLFKFALSNLKFFNVGKKTDGDSLLTFGLNFFMFELLEYTYKHHPRNKAKIQAIINYLLQCSSSHFMLNNSKLFNLLHTKYDCFNITKLDLVKIYPSCLFVCFLYAPAEGRMKLLREYIVTTLKYSSTKSVSHLIKLLYTEAKFFNQNELADILTNLVIRLEAIYKESNAKKEVVSYITNQLQETLLSAKYKNEEFSSRGNADFWDMIKNYALDDWKEEVELKERIKHVEQLFSDSNTELATAFRELLPHPAIAQSR